MTYTEIEILTRRIVPMIYQLVHNGTVAVSINDEVVGKAMADYDINSTARFRPQAAPIVKATVQTILEIEKARRDDVAKS